MRPRSVPSVTFYATFYLYAQTAVDAVTYTPEEPQLFCYEKSTMIPNLSTMPG